MSNLLKTMLAIIGLLFLVLAYLLFAEFPLKFYITNNSSSDIDKVVVSMVEGDDKKVASESFENITVGSVQTFKWTPGDVSDSDGGYMFEVYKDGEKIMEKGFGYYTNGGHLDYEYFVTVSDTEITISLAK